MKVALLPVGTRGDVQPMVALGVELRRRGHDVVVGSAENFRPLIEAHGLTFASGGRDVQTVVLELGEALDDLGKMLPLTRHLVAEQFDLVDPVVAGADFVIGTPLSVASAIIAEQHKVPFAWVAFFPSSWPSTDVPPPVFPNAPRFATGPLWWLYRRLTDFALGRIVADQRARRGLPPMGMWQGGARFPVLAAFDDVVGTVPQGWPMPFVQTGTWFLDDPAPLADDLRAFLDAGDPPVFLGFGSMPHDDVAARSAVIDAAFQRLGRRVIVGRGWQKLHTAHAAGVFVVEDVNHARLFPRCAVIVHHGGAGTTAQAARAGVPQVVIPHMFDQYYWARRVHALGVAGPPLPSAFTADALVAAIEAALSPASQSASTSVAERVRASRGVLLAADWIENEGRLRRRV